MKTKNIIKNIKKKSNDVMKDRKLIPKESKVHNFFGWLFVIVASVFLIWEILFLLLKIKWISIILLIFFVITLITGIVNIVIDRCEKSKHEKKREDINDILYMALDDEAQKYDVSPEQLALYIKKQYDKSKVFSIISFIITIIFTSLAVYCIPGFDEQENNWVEFVVIVFGNLVVSTAGNYTFSEFKNFTNISFYLDRPFEKSDKTIKEKLKNMK